MNDRYRASETRWPILFSTPPQKRNKQLPRHAVQAVVDHYGVSKHHASHILIVATLRFESRLWATGGVGRTVHARCIFFYLDNLAHAIVLVVAP